MDNILLTIDFDVIMYPSIDLYNNFVFGIEDNIENVENDIPLLKYANADLNLYLKLTEYLIKAKNHGCQFKFINSHEDILNYCDNLDTIINIDHHHDLGYNDEQRENDIIGCANWAYQGLKNKKFKNYMWLHNYNSEPFYLIKNFSIINMCINNVNFEQLFIPNQIIICSSYSWIPTSIRPLYNLWKKILEEK